MNTEQYKGTILIVDDEPVTQLMIEMMLQRNNYKAILAFDGNDALKHLENEKIDMVITDVNMPNMGGMTLLQRLRADQRYKNLPVVMFTALGQRDVQSKAIDIGATGFLTKPISSNKLIDVVTQYLNRPQKAFS